MTALQILEGIAVAVGVGFVGVLGGIAFETISALLNKERRAHIRQRGFWGSARHMLS